MIRMYRSFTMVQGFLSWLTSTHHLYRGNPNIIQCVCYRSVALRSSEDGMGNCFISQLFMTGELQTCSYLCVCYTLVTVLGDNEIIHIDQMPGILEYQELIDFFLTRVIALGFYYRHMLQHDWGTLLYQGSLGT